MDKYNIAMDQELLERFKENGGYFRNPGLLSRSEKYQLHLALKNGIISRVKRGLYRLNGITMAYQEAEVAQIVPAGIFCMHTAWAYFELTTHISSLYHMAVPKSLKVSIPDYPPIKLYFWGKATFESGQSEVIINGARVKMYDIEKSVCDAVKFRNKIGPDLLGEIIRNYVRRDDKNLDKLMKYAAELRISGTLNQLLQVIL